MQNQHVLPATALFYLEHFASRYVRWIVAPALATLRGWSRRAEVTCDRAGLLCTRDVDVSASALQKTGVAAEYVEALRVFAESEYYRAMLKQPGGTTPEACDERVAEVLKGRGGGDKRRRGRRTARTTATPTRTATNERDCRQVRPPSKRSSSPRSARLPRSPRGWAWRRWPVTSQGTRIPKLEEERFALVVLGEFNHGKSTFVNALCGAAILPAGITPTTATINHLLWADKPVATAHLVDDTHHKRVDPKKLGDLGGRSRARRRPHVKYVEVGWPAEILKDKVTLVDTPGVNDINEQRAEITYGYIPRADAVLFLLDGAQVLKQSERAFLEQRILRAA